jgi:hypothetical protein
MITRNAAPRRYAADTRVPVDRTRSELEKLVTTHGATAFGVFSEGWAKSVVMYRLSGRFIRHTVKVEPKTRSSKAAIEQEQRRAWRALLLIVRAKLEIIASGDSTVDREFLADTVLADGTTVYDQVGQGVAQSYLDGGMPSLGLLGPGDS